MLDKFKTFFSEATEFAGRRAPVAGVFAFSACSVHAVAHLLLDKAEHGTPLYWIAAALIELATAWLTMRIIEQVQQATRSIGRGFGKQDRRFARIMLGAYIGLTVPSFATSVIANRIEFGGDKLLSFLFPVLTVACAAGAAMPDIIEDRKRRKKKETAAQAGEKATKAEEMQAQQRDSWTQALANLGKAADTLRLIAESNSWTRASIAKDLDVSPQAISGHLKRLESAGLIDRSNGSVKLPDGLTEMLKEGGS